MKNISNFVSWERLWNDSVYARSGMLKMFFSAERLAFHLFLHVKQWFNFCDVATFPKVGIAFPHFGCTSKLKSFSYPLPPSYHVPLVRYRANFPPGPCRNSRDESHGCGGGRGGCKVYDRGTPLCRHRYLCHSWTLIAAVEQSRLRVFRAEHRSPLL